MQATRPKFTACKKHAQWNCPRLSLGSWIWSTLHTWGRHEEVEVRRSFFERPDLAGCCFRTPHGEKQIESSHLAESLGSFGFGICGRKASPLSWLHCGTLRILGFKRAGLGDMQNVCLSVSCTCIDGLLAQPQLHKSYRMGFVLEA